MSLLQTDVRDFVDRLLLRDLPGRVRGQGSGVALQALLPRRLPRPAANGATRELSAVQNERLEVCLGDRTGRQEQEFGGRQGILVQLNRDPRWVAQRYHLGRDAGLFVAPILLLPPASNDADDNNALP